MIHSEIADCIAKLENLFCPKNENFGGLNADQASEYARAWKHERADVVLEAIGLFWRSDPDFSKRRIAPPPALIEPFIKGTKDRIRREATQQKKTEQNPDVSPAVAKYRAYMWRCINALYTAKRHLQQPENLIFYSFENGRLKGSARYSLLDTFVLCFVEFGQFALSWENYLEEVALVSKEVALALADKETEILRDAEAFRLERYPATPVEVEDVTSSRGDDALEAFFADRDRDPLRAEMIEYEEIEEDVEEEPLF